MKGFIKKIYSAYFKYRNRKKAIIGRGCVFGFKSRIINRTGSAKSIIIANNVMMHGTLIAEGGGVISLQEKVNIRRGTYIGAVNSINIGRGTIISDSVSIMDNDNHPTSPTERIKMVDSGWSSSSWSWVNSASKSIEIGENVWICQGVRILKGVSLANDSIVAAGSVVTKSFSEPSVIAGNPAKAVKLIKC
ncbi:acyltransferase [Pseudoalteromonas lipolytica]|uniref:acyltransferase n=1 Tax=Pseudoalteromonas lipolytica TaxID=570156 RepID=UPI003BA21AF4